MVDQVNGSATVIGLFANVASAAPGREWWDGEDPDNYRFLREATADLGIDLVTVSDGRGVWGVNQAEGMLANNRVPFCSRMGNDQAVHLLRTRPDVYRGHETREEEFRAAKGRNVSILVDRRGVGNGPRKPLPLRQLREEVERFDATNPRLPGLEPEPMFGDGFVCGCNQADP